jgi:hypothetical protein
MQKAFYVLFLFYFLLGMGVSAAVGGIVGGGRRGKGARRQLPRPCMCQRVMPAWLAT